MSKLTRKLLISVFTLAFALITLGTTTFAWFTLSSTVNVSQFDMNASAGRGIEISLDNVTYKNQITLQDLKNKFGLGAGTNIFKTLDPITTADGKNFYNLENLTATTPSALDDGWFELDLYFRSAEENVRVYLDTGTTTTSAGVNWTPDATFVYNGQKSPTTPVDVFTADSLRMSFEEYSLNFTSGKPGKMTIWELNPTGRDGAGENIILGSAPNPTDGLVPYWAAKLNEDIIDKYYTKGKFELPATTYTNTDLGLVDTNNPDSEPKNVVLTLNNEKTGDYYYGYLKVRMWLEGWDPDNFDAIFNGTLSVKFQFSVAAPEAVRHTVTFESNGGDTVNSIQVVDGTAFTAPTAPEKADDATNSYAFDGWYTDVELTTAYDFQTLVTGPLTLYAKWIETPIGG